MRNGSSDWDGAAIKIRGQKPDWLSEGLDRQPEVFVTGVRRRLTGDVAGRVSVRSIAHWPRGARRPYGLAGNQIWIPPYNVFMRHLLCIAVSSTGEMRPCFDAVLAGEWPLTLPVSEMLGARRALIVFSENDVGASFVVADRTAGVRGEIKPTEYASILNRERNDPVEPMMKPLKKGYADALHYWSRHSLQGKRGR